MKKKSRAPFSCCHQSNKQKDFNASRGRGLGVLLVRRDRKKKFALPVCIIKNRNRATTTSRYTQSDCLCCRCV